MRLLSALLLLALACAIALPLEARAGGAASDEPVENEPATTSLQPGDSIWLDGANGDDANDGTEDSPVRTFARAKELLEANGSDLVWVTGTIQISGTSETWDLDGKTLMRDGGFTGELVHLSGGASLTLEDVTIDGGIGNGARGKASSADGSGGSLVGVFDDSTLTIGEGAVLQNNHVMSTGHWMPEAGGAVFASDGTVNVEGGTITGNSAVYGGGISATLGSTVNMSSGTISNNSAIKGTAKGGDAERGYSGTGGGIVAWRGATVNLSGGTISNNSAYERGGGISMGSYQTYYGDASSVLTMTGGTITGNSAGSAGGGLFVQYGLSAEGGGGTPTYCVARITGGTISNNTMTDEGESNSMFGGGGIYINGISSSYPVFHNGELYIVNAEISGNSASIVGGGYAGCPASSTGIALTNGAVLYGNSTDSGGARELYILASTALGAHSDDPDYEISPSMLGGGAYRWTYDDGTEVPLDKLQGTLRAVRNDELRLSNGLTEADEDVRDALELATVHITGNRSETRGGGIGSNGSLFVGATVEVTKVNVTKVWNDADEERPDEVTVELYRDGEYVGYQVMKPDSNGTWSTTFKNLPKTDEDGRAYDYTVREREVAGYVSEVSGDAASGFTITNTRTTKIDVSKVWDDGDDSGTRPSSITVDLLRDGEVVDSATVEPDESGSWAHTFADLPMYDADGNRYAYTVEEHEVAGYVSKVSGNAEGGFTITNTKKPETPTTPETPKKALTPKTGDDLGGTSGAMTIAGAACALGATALVLRRTRNEG